MTIPRGNSKMFRISFVISNFETLRLKVRVALGPRIPHIPSCVITLYAQRAQVACSNLPRIQLEMNQCLIRGNYFIRRTGSTRKYFTMSGSSIPAAFKGRGAHVRCSLVLCKALQGFLCRYLLVVEDGCTAFLFSFPIGLSLPHSRLPSFAFRKRYKRTITFQFQRQLSTVRISRLLTTTLLPLTIYSDDRHSFIIPHTQLTLHLTILSPQTPLPGANTLKCLHTFAQSILTDPPTKSFEHIRTQAIKDVKVMLAPAHCPVCGFTNRDACKVLAGLWYFISREKLLYAQRYGVFEGRTGRMVAWGTLLTGSMATDVLGDMDVDPAVPLGLAEIS